MKSLVFVFCLLWGLPADAQQTALDSAFGTSGRVNPLIYPLTEPDYPVFCAQQADGKLLVAATSGWTPSPLNVYYNTIRVNRLHSDGRLDSTFNAIGTFEHKMAHIGHVLGVRTLQNGKIIAVAKTFNSSVYTLRLKSDGTPDSSYHGIGIAIHPSPQLWDAAILADGSVVFTGNKFNSPGGYDLAVFKLDSAGNPDATFGTAGTALYNFGLGIETLGIRIAEASGGKFLVSAVKDLTGSGTDSVGVLRILSNGSPDLTFGNGGSVFKHIPHTWIRAEDAVEGPGGAVTFAAYYQPLTDTLYHRMLFRTTSSGIMDAAFGAMGVRELTSLPLQNTYTNVGFYDRGGRTTLCHQPDGKLIVEYTSTYGIHYSSEPCLLRLLPDGTYDASFGTNGWMNSYMRPFTMNSEVLIQPDGKIVQVGNGYDRVDMVRYKPITLLSVEPLSQPTSAIRIYPNPTTGAEVRIEGAPTDAITYVTDAAGRIVKAPGHAGNLDVSQLPPGLYFLRIESSTGSASFRLIKSER